MLSARYTAFLTCCTLQAFGQGLPIVADTAGYVKGGYAKFTDTFYLGAFTTTDSTTIRVP